MFDWYVYADTRNIRDFENFLAFYKILVLSKFKAAHMKWIKSWLARTVQSKRKKKVKKSKNPYPMKILHRYLYSTLGSISNNDLQEKCQKEIADDTKIDGSIDNDKVSSVKSLRAGDKMGFA